MRAFSFSVNFISHSDDDFQKRRQLVQNLLKLLVGISEKVQLFLPFPALTYVELIEQNNNFSC
jgi:hypothetical protein